ncbi:MAG: RnfABCDGE type electron transport complex subunit D [Oscillospiraceae bacterium]|nr:RnfABCDGE type electron transport complex subunit D [Oscillospiraceae bacterium]
MNRTNLFRVSPGPHVRSGLTTGSVMYDVLLALLPAAVFGVGRFGMRAFLILAAAVLSAVSMEYVFDCLTGKGNTIRDGSAAVTGLLLGLSLPPDVPMYIPYIGAAVAVVLVKGVFGGLGRNRVNPALAGRCLLAMLFTGAMTAFYRESGGGALTGSGTELVRMLIGTKSAVIGGSVVALLAGGAWLLASGHISWHIPTAVTLSWFVLSLLVDGASAALSETLFFLAGGGMLAAFFMATDPVTSPVTDLGRGIFGVIVGAAAFLLGKRLGPAEAVCCAVLLANLTVPLLDRCTVPKPLD